MIRQFPPQRLGCSPGGDCCDDCRSHRTGPPIGPAATHVHALRGVRNVALRRALGDVMCDDEGQNCYDVTATIHYGDPVDLMTGPPVSPTDPRLQISSTSSSSTAGISKVWLYGGLALLGVLVLEGSSRRR